MPNKVRKNWVGVASVAELFLYFDEEYVTAAYHFFLGRDPDPEGFGNYLEQIRSGTPRHQIASTMSMSPEAQRRRGVTLNASGQNSGSSGEEVLAFPETLRGLCLLNDRAFIDAAYQMVLGREPDVDGMSNYLIQLRSGKSKQGLLSDIVHSPEFRKRKQLNLSLLKEHKGSTIGVNVEPQAIEHAMVGLICDLEKAANRYGLGQLPIIGWLFRFLFDVEGEREIEKRFRRLENQIYLLGSKELSEIEERVSPAQFYQSKMAVKLEKTSQRIDEFDSPDIRPSVTILRSAALKLRTLNTRKVTTRA